MTYEVGTRVMALGKSLHAGQYGTFIKDENDFIVVKAEDQTYSGAGLDSVLGFKIFYLDRDLVKVIQNEK